MTSTTISQLKVNPSAVIAQSIDYPVAVENRNKIQAYILGKNLYEAMVIFIEDYIDKKAFKNADFSKHRKAEDVFRDLGL